MVKLVKNEIEKDKEKNEDKGEPAKGCGLSSLKYKEGRLKEMKENLEELKEEIDISEKFIKQQRLSFKKGDARMITLKSKFSEEPKKAPGVV